MPMNFNQQSAAATDATFIQMVEQAMIKVSQDIATEAVGVAGHAARYAFAVQCLRSPDVFAPLLARGVVADTTTDKTATDAAIYNRLSAIWNGYAGA